MVRPKPACQRYLPTIRQYASQDIFPRSRRFAIHWRYGGRAGHVEQFRRLYGFDVTPWFPVPGKIGVVLFFVLSGFLITFLLLDETERKGRIGVANFYVRRALRIWPLYFACVAAAIFIFNPLPSLNVGVRSTTFFENLSLHDVLCYLVLLPHFAYQVIPFSGQMWSIGVEEQFYLLQPLVLVWLKGHFGRLLAFGSMIMVPEALAFTNAYLGNSGLAPGWLTEKLLRLQHYSVYFSNISVGCFTAVLVVEKEALVARWIFSAPAQCLNLSGLVTVLVMSSQYTHTPIPDLKIHAVMFAVLIVNMALNPSSVITLSSPLLNSLGKNSYGVYMLHPFCIGLVLVALAAVGPKSWPPALVTFVAYPVVVGSTLALSQLSFRYFESYFLGLKRGFQVKIREQAYASV